MGWELTMDGARLWAAAIGDGFSKPELEKESKPLFILSEHQSANRNKPLESPPLKTHPLPLPRA